MSGGVNFGQRPEHPDANDLPPWELAGWLAPPWQAKGTPTDTHEPPHPAETVDSEASSEQSLAERIAARLLSAEDLIAMPPPSWRIDGMLMAGTVVTLFGEPASYKTFVALDLSLSIGMKLPWQAREVDGGPVIYISGEGIGGLGMRLAAWKEAFARETEVFDVHSGTFKKEPLTGVSFFPGQLNLLDPERRDALAEIVRVRQPKLLVIDTLQRAMVGGDENSTRDVGRVYEAADVCREQAPGLTTMAVHHTTKDGATYRGASVIEGNSCFGVMRRGGAG